MNNYNTSYQYKQLNTRDIEIDPAYQREVKKAEVAAILKNFDNRIVNVVKVSYRDGHYYCFDGQQTMTALKAKSGGGDLMVDCKVFYDLTQLDETELFKKQTGNSSKVSTADKVRADYNTGEPDTVRFVQLTEKCGLQVNFNCQRGTNKIVAVSSLLKIFKDAKCDADYLDLLGIVKSSWGGDGESLRKEIFRGVWLFMKAYKGEYNKKTLISKLSRVSPKTIIREAKISTASGDRKYAIQILNTYNKNASKNRLLETL